MAGREMDHYDCVVIGAGALHPPGSSVAFALRPSQTRVCNNYWSQFAHLEQPDRMLRSCRRQAISLALPRNSLAILESETSLGGSFADHRLYPGLKSNNLLGTFEYGDFPMNSDEFGVKPGEHIPGEVINRYLKMYAKEFGIAELIQFDTKVLSARAPGYTRRGLGPDGGWFSFGR